VVGVALAVDDDVVVVTVVVVVAVVTGFTVAGGLVETVALESILFNQFRL
jgi:hypothetical protein